jgi:hypothetical protein
VAASLSPREQAGESYGRPGERIRITVPAPPGTCGIGCRALVSPWVLSYLAGPPLFIELPTRRLVGNSMNNPHTLQLQEPKGLQELQLLEKTWSGVGCARPL